MAEQRRSRDVFAVLLFAVATLLVLQIVGFREPGSTLTGCNDTLSVAEVLKWAAALTDSHFNNSYAGAERPHPQERSMSVHFKAEGVLMAQGAASLVGSVLTSSLLRSPPPGGGLFLPAVHSLNPPNSNVSGVRKLELSNRLTIGIAAAVHSGGSPVSIKELHIIKTTVASFLPTACPAYTYRSESPWMQKRRTPVMMVPQSDAVRVPISWPLPFLQVLPGI